MSRANENLTGAGDPPREEPAYLGFVQALGEGGGPGTGGIPGV